ncbi:hypothetical protein COY90_02865 [Candidatus Roizmanbacteria bacterium CG_4_10_14_0_8_um_filter_39_9]|uniref:Uncharacterized protein n=1 Tax=Candidatus Roizmanbacteria bacterium CG_4_10_14_0_8_um_filter_39_9 TaxID=1974829 RepID=A0A2M7QE27_9BACT|nr:MAG: hypothetical protein COY90_02865 [Candidatus Roizmanbacteria bacterium CG_4_10_14_0_8_um_filter_39_9]
MTEQSSTYRATYTNAYFDMVRAKTEGRLNFPEQNLVDGTAPSLDVQRMILFLKPPLAYPNESPIQFQVEEQRLLHKLMVHPLVVGNGPKRSTEQSEQVGRSRQNITTAIKILEGGFGEKKRRTGEKYTIHPLRVFARGALELNHIGLNHLSLFNTSSLTRILHDCKEDFRNFTITKTGERVIADDSVVLQKTINTYSVTFKDQPPGDEYILEMEPQEMELFDLQMNAVSIPPHVQQMKNGDEKTKAQVNHLFTNVIKINKLFGSMAAYQTLKIKLDDRTDNIFTYFDAPGSGNSKDKFQAKLHETILFFTEVEKASQKYFEVFAASLPDNALKKVKENGIEQTGSIIALCYYLLRGGTYQDILQGYIDAEREEVRQGTNYNSLLIPNPRPSPPIPRIIKITI